MAEGGTSTGEELDGTQCYNSTDDQKMRVWGILCTVLALELAEGLQLCLNVTTAEIIGKCQVHRSRLAALEASGRIGDEQAGNPSERGTFAEDLTCARKVRLLDVFS